jgi:hypothetical protein
VRKNPIPVGVSTERVICTTTSRLAIATPASTVTNANWGMGCALLLTQTVVVLMASVWKALVFALTLTPVPNASCRLARMIALAMDCAFTHPMKHPDVSACMVLRVKHARNLVAAKVRTVLGTGAATAMPLQPKSS